MEQEMPDYETIRAAVAGEKWALEKVLACYGDEINRLAMVKKRQPDGSVKEEIIHVLTPFRPGGGLFIPFRLPSTDVPQICQTE